MFSSKGNVIRIAGIVTLIPAIFILSGCAGTILCYSKIERCRYLPK